MTVPVAEPQWLTVAEAGVAIRASELRARELTEATLRWVEATDELTRAWVTVMADRALEEADRADADFRAGIDRGPLQGIGYAVKDLIEVEGAPMTVGSRLVDGFAPDSDAPVVRALAQAGAVCLGKVATHEFAFGSTTPPTRNPWDGTSVTGGSSGGSAAAVAAGQAPAAIGTDCCCSVRNPAALNGICGIRPTFGRVSATGVVPASLGMDTVGPLCRTVEDAAILLTAMSGHDPADPRSSTAPVPRFDAGLDELPSGLVAGIPSDHFLEHLEPGVAAAVDAATAVLERLGIELREIPMPHAHLAVPAFFTIDLAEEAAMHDDWLYARAAELGADVRRWAELGNMVLAKDYVRAQQARTLVVEDWEQAFEDVDVVLTPATAATAKQPVDDPVLIDVRYADGHVEDVVFAYGRNLIPVSLAGLPALVVPCGFSDGLPVGLQIVAPAFDEQTALRVGHAYESETDWHRRRPAALAGHSGSRPDVVDTDSVLE